MERSYQVVIVGGGPVGLALAVDLGQRNISCLLVERHASLHRIPKGQNLSRRSLEHFYFWGVADELRAARLLPPGYPIGGIVAYRDLTTDYWFAHLNHAVAPDHYFQANERLPQYLTEQVLRRRVQDLPTVTALFGWTVDRIDEGDAGLRVALSSQEDGRLVEAGYVVGCDGGHSMVRRHLGIDRGGPDFDQRMVLAVFRSRELHQALRRFPERTTYRVMHPAAKGYWHFFGRVDVGEGWFFHAPVPRHATIENDDVHAFIQRAAGFPFAAQFDHVGFWDLRIAVATAYQRGRVFIAGDAAHTHPPYGGYGLNSGLEDVANLGWKLAARLQGWAGDRLLDSYTEERQPIFLETGRAVIAGGIELDRAFLESCTPESDRPRFDRAWQDWQAALAARQESYEPNYAGSSIVWGPPGARCTIHGRHDYAARPGHHLAPRLLSTGRDIYQELGRDFTLLALDADSRPLSSAAARLRIPLKVIHDTYQAPRTAYGSRLILIRPDQYVAWTADAPPPNPEPILRRLTAL